jgi:hypothetical protein
LEQRLKLARGAAEADAATPPLGRQLHAGQHIDRGQVGREGTGVEDDAVDVGLIERSQRQCWSFRYSLRPAGAAKVIDGRSSG